MLLLFQSITTTILLILSIFNDFTTIANAAATEEKKKKNNAVKAETNVDDPLDPSYDKHLVNTLDDEMCYNLTKNGKNEENSELMAKYCTKTWYEWKKKSDKFSRLKDKRDSIHLNIEGGDELFFELKAKNTTGSMIEFEKFEGYITLVAFIPKACDSGVAADETLQTLTDIRNVWPKIVEIIAFPYEHPDSHYYATEEDCSTDHYNEAFTKRSLNLNSMKEIHIHRRDLGEGRGFGKPHTVYTYFQKLLEFPSISATSPTIFIVSPTGIYIEAFYNGSEKEKIKTSIRKFIDREL